MSPDAMPAIDLTDPRQNEFVQDYLSALLRESPTNTHKEDQAVELTIELIQETYKP